MEGRSNVSSRWPGSTSAPTVTGEGPVRPTSMAISQLRPLGLSEVALSEDGDLGAWQQRNSIKTLPHCVEQVVASGAVRNLQRVAEGHDGDGRHEGLHFSDSDVYKTLEAAAWDGVRGASDGVEQFIDEVSATLGAPSGRTGTSIRGSKDNTLN